MEHFNLKKVEDQGHVKTDDLFDSINFTNPE